jgi:hypothetical protein
MTAHVTVQLRGKSPVRMSAGDVDDRMDTLTEVVVGEAYYRGRSYRGM